jgi:four helix bundle protein
MDKVQNPNIKIPNKSQLPNPKSQGTYKVYDLRERLFDFSKRILQICKILPKISECEGIRKQLANAGTSIAANYEEADGALTKKDFINKVAIARKEAKETRYWLRVISGTYIEGKETIPDIKESEEIINILSAILRNCGARPWH